MINNILLFLFSKKKKKILTKQRIEKETLPKKSCSFVSAKKKKFLHMDIKCCYFVLLKKKNMFKKTSFSKQKYKNGLETIPNELKVSKFILEFG